MAASDHPAFKSNAELDLTIRELAQGLAPEERKPARSRLESQARQVKRAMRKHKGIVGR